jgi:hypothetical protein
MALTLKLTTDATGCATPWLDGQALAAPTSLAALPQLPALQADPYTEGQRLFAALGGPALRHALEADPDALLLLDLDEAALAVPWEFAALPGAQLLGYRARIRNHGHSCFLCEIVIRSQFHTTYEPEHKV